MRRRKVGADPTAVCPEARTVAGRAGTGRSFVHLRHRPARPRAGRRAVPATPRGVPDSQKGTNDVLIDPTAICLGGHGHPQRSVAPGHLRDPARHGRDRPGRRAGPAAAAAAAAPTGEYAQRFLAQYDKIKDPANGYFSPQGIPYHSVETLIVEAPDYGHETTSEAYSYWIWLEALYGQVTEDWAPLNHAWDTIEKYMIPPAADQPTNSFYNPASPATYASEFNHPSSYPSQLQSGVTSGRTRSPPS